MTLVHFDDAVIRLMQVHTVTCHSFLNLTVKTALKFVAVLPIHMQLCATNVYSTRSFK